MENKGKGKIAITLVILVLVAFGAGVTAYMAFWKDKQDSVAAGDPKAIIDRLRVLQVTGGKLEVSEAELNGTLKTLFSKPVERAGIVVKDVYADINSGGVTFYAPVKYKNMDLLPNVTGKIRYENEKVIFDISSVRVGKLGIPKSILLEQLRNFSNEDIKISGNSIEISKYLLPFNAKNVYLQDDKLIADVDKLNILKEAASVTAGTDKTGTSAPKGNSTQNTGSKETAKGGSSSQTSGGDKKNTETSVPDSVKASQTETLKKVSGQLNGVISSVSTPKEKQMMQKIQRVVSEVSKDPSYPYQGDANEVKAWYSTLQPEAKVRVRNAILRNVNPMEILKLINIFGV